jgi:hypothetical protein
LLILEGFPWLLMLTQIFTNKKCVFLLYLYKNWIVLSIFLWNLLSFKLGHFSKSVDLSNSFQQPVFCNINAQVFFFFQPLSIWWMLECLFFAITHNTEVNIHRYCGLCSYRTEFPKWFPRTKGTDVQNLIGTSMSAS